MSKEKEIQLQFVETDGLALFAETMQFIDESSIIEL